jgi:transcriptional regulator with XRE-family HTH domain
LGAAILAARTAAGLSQTELGAKLKTAQTNIARLEKGGSIPSTTTLQRIAKATGHKLMITFSRDT